MRRRRLIVVSNRGPVSFSRSGAERVARRGGGGLVSGLHGLVSLEDATWIASAMTDEDRRVAAESGDEGIAEATRDGGSYRLRLLAHDPAAYEGYYNVVANPTLWFLQHYLWGLGAAPDVDGRLRTAWSDGYASVNRAFADAVLSELERDPAAAVCFHDYHLYLAPRFVREGRRDALLMHFVHIPWAEPDYWHVLPGDLRRAVHAGVLANDVVGFHTDRWRRNFLQACEEILGAEHDEETGLLSFEGREIRAVTRPIAIDPVEFDELKTSPGVLAEERAIAASRPELLILRVDRTDPSKNILRGFRALRLCLERHPELRGRVRMLALLDPSRQDLPEYAAYAAAIESEARTINEQFPGPASEPLVDLQIADNFPQAVAAYKQYDVLLVNPVYDGMNLVAKEAPLVNERAGVVILSENAGAHAELGEWTLTVNPFDIEEQAQALYEGLTMPRGERERRAAALAAYVREHDAEAWIAKQLADLDAVERLPSAG
jgi:trehalose 6-phosphate synthase